MEEAFDSFPSTGKLLCQLNDIAKISCYDNFKTLAKFSSNFSAKLVKFTIDSFFSKTSEFSLSKKKLQNLSGKFKKSLVPTSLQGVYLFGHQIQ